MRREVWLVLAGALAGAGLTAAAVPPPTANEVMRYAKRLEFTYAGKHWTCVQRDEPPAPVTP